ncbi:MAG TPA: adenylate/guanylate cyclase domain-containing protein [Gemmatimonadota bacterium]|nr:adenylate/guanylate cyclase domain-containing protein [Gemmatimonadota bacterium]
MSAKARERRLAAVWFADIVGFTALASRDEDAALKLKEIFQAITRKVVRELGGTLVKFLGDGGLAVFPSADAAVRAGLDVQRAFEARTSAAGVAAQLRVGVHLGEVVTESDGDVYGDGVNTAARIQHEAEPGQVVVSEDVWRQLRQRSGYQFDALGERTLQGLEEPVRIYAVGGTPEEAHADPVESHQPPRRFGRGRRIALAGAVAMVIVAIGWWLSTRQGGGPTAAEAAPSIAVLPFADLSPGGDQEYFGDGMTEELINALTRIEGLAVVSRTSAFAYKGKNLDVRDIGRRLGVGTVMEGSVRVAGDRLRITAQLIDVDNGYHLWSETYDREMADVFAIQDEIARAIVTELEPELVTSGRIVPRRTGDPEAYRLYLEGRFLWSQRTYESTMRAIELFEAAIRADTTYAVAYTGLADSYESLLGRGFRTAAETLDKQRAAIHRALELDPELSEAHKSLANLLFNQDWDWEAAGRAFERAVELDPRNADAAHAYSHYLTAMGRTRESLDESLRALEISPYDDAIRSHLGWHYLFARDPGRAVEAMAGRMSGYHGFLARAYQLQGRNAEALVQCERAVAERGSDAFLMGFVGFVYAQLGHEREALDVARRLEAMGDQTSYDVAVIHAGLGDAERAFALLEEGYAKRSPRMVYLKVDPRLDDLRSDPRFDSLVRRMRL